MIGLLIILAAVSGAVLLSVDQKPDPAPQASLELREGQIPPVHYLRHRGGEEIGGDGRTVVRGVANPDVLQEDPLTAGEGESVVPVVPVDDRIRLIWYGDDGTSYVLWEGSPSSYLRATPDKDCEWVAEETDNGTDPITVDGVVVTCDIVTEGDVDVVNGALVVGTVNSTENNVDLDDSEVYGPVEADGDVDLDGTNVSGSVSSGGGDVVLTDGSTVAGDVRTGPGGTVDVDGGSSVDGSVVAGDDVDLDSATVGGDVRSDGGDVVLTDTTVDGNVRTGSSGTVDVDGTTVGGDVYVDPGDFSCATSTIDGQDCGTYTPK